jgi:hypothetical protein
MSIPLTGDPINHPTHYTNEGDMECIEAIVGMLGSSGAADYCRGNIVKYLWRYREKNGVEDLRKAQWYLSKIIDIEEEKDALDLTNKTQRFFSPRGER